MTIKKRIVKGKIYYYLEKNLRLGENNWKTFYVYLGSKIPNQKKLKELGKKLEKNIAEYLSNQILKPKTEFIDQKTALFLERIKTASKELLIKLEHKNKEKYLKRQRETFITNTNAIEGSRLTLDQTKKILELRFEYEVEDREELEVLNMQKCLEFYDQLLAKKMQLDEKLILKLHFLLIKSIPKYESYAGVWRPVNVYIRGSNYDFPDWKQVPKLISELISWYEENSNKIHPVELAAKFHAKFVTIHPFADGNGRMARLLLNYILQINNYPFTDIEFSKRDEYFKTQEEGHFEKYKPFVLFLVEVIKTQFKKLKKQMKQQ